MSMLGLSVGTTSAVAIVRVVEEAREDVVAVGADDQPVDRRTQCAGRSSPARTLPKLPVGTANDDRPAAERAPPAVA